MARRKRLKFEQLKSKAYDKNCVQIHPNHGSGGNHHFWIDMYNFSGASHLTFDEFVKNPVWQSYEKLENLISLDEYYCSDLAIKNIMAYYDREFTRPKGYRATHNQYGWIEK